MPNGKLFQEDEFLFDVIYSMHNPPGGKLTSRSGSMLSVNSDDTFLNVVGSGLILRMDDGQCAEVLLRHVKGNDASYVVSGGLFDCEEAG